MKIEMDNFTAEYKYLESLDQNFDSYNDLKNQLDKGCNTNFVPIKTRNSKLANDIPSEIIYSYIY